MKSMIPEKLSARLRLLRWVLPLSTAALVIFYQLVVSHWIHYNWGEGYRSMLELLFYGTAGPVFAFLMLDIFARWMEEKETSELQSQVLAQTREHIDAGRQLNDQALQTLYATSIYLASLKRLNHDLPAEVKSQLEETERVLDIAMRDLRAHLQSAAKNGGVRVRV
jgi:signal transduction histidine kinase